MVTQLREGSKPPLQLPRREWGNSLNFDFRVCQWKAVGCTSECTVASHSPPPLPLFVRGHTVVNLEFSKRLAAWIQFREIVRVRARGPFFKWDGSGRLMFIRNYPVQARFRESARNFEVHFEPSRYESVRQDHESATPEIWRLNPLQDGTAVLWNIVNTPVTKTPEMMADRVMRFLRGYHSKQYIALNHSAMRSKSSGER